MNRFYSKLFTSKINKQLLSVTKRNITCVSTCQYKITHSSSSVLNHRSKWELVNEILFSRGILNKDQVIMDPEIIHVDHLKRVHDSDYVDSFLNDKMDIQMLKKIGLGVSSSTGTIGKDVYDRVMHVIGATLQASRISLENADGRAANLSGGAHHAFRSYGSGYCVFNDIVVAGEALISEGKIERYLVVDLDVHQGDGTAAMLEGNPNAFTFSMHCEKNFPMVKKKSSWDVALPEFTGDEQYLSTLDKCLKHMLKNRNKSFNYDFVFYQSGVDVLSGDGLGRLSLTMEGIRQRDELVSQFIAQSSCPVTVVMGGGYPKGDHTAHVVATAHAQTIEMMNRY